MEQIFVWTLSDVIGVVIAAVIACLWVVIAGDKLAREMFCIHDAGVNETSACEAICRKCGKNLGFIGNLRKSHVD